MNTLSLTSNSRYLLNQPLRRLQSLPRGLAPSVSPANYHVRVLCVDVGVRQDIERLL